MVQSRASFRARTLAAGVRELPVSATVAIDARSKALVEQGSQVFRFGFGQSPFPVPPSVVDALCRNAGAKDYLPVAGLPRLRTAVVQHLGRTSGVAARAEDVLIGPGSKMLMFLLQLVLDAELLVPSPAWVSYAPQARLLGRPVRWIETTFEDDWTLTSDALSAACANDSGRTRILVLNSPGNPTGTSYSAERLNALAAIARRHDVLVLWDEIYGPLHHGPVPASIASFCPERTIISAGLSKWCGAGGWRLGTFVFPTELAWLRRAVIVAASETYTSTAAPIQHAAVVAYEGNAEIDRYQQRSRWILGALGRWCQARLSAAGIDCASPTGGFYLFPRFSRGHRGFETSDTLCEQLLTDTGVALLPGSAFGRPASELSARLAYVDFDGAGALSCLPKDGGLPSDEETEVVLRQACPRVIEGIDKIVDWSR